MSAQGEQIGVAGHVSPGLRLPARRHDRDLIRRHAGSDKSGAGGDNGLCKGADGSAGNVDCRERSGFVGAAMLGLRAVRSCQLGTGLCVSWAVAVAGIKGGAQSADQPIPSGMGRTPCRSGGTSR